MIPAAKPSPRTRVALDQGGERDHQRRREEQARNVARHSRDRRWIGRCNNVSRPIMVIPITVISPMV